VTAACGSGEDVRQSSDFLATALAETGASKLGSGQSLARMPASDRVPLSPRREQIRRPAAGSVGTGGSDYHVLPPPVELDNLTVSMRLPFKHILSVKQWDKALLYRLFQVATQMRMHVKSDRGGTDLLKGRVLASVFYEPSTRTSCSFIAAMQRLGGSVITLHDVANTSVSKGESLADTMRTMEALCDVTVMRHPGKNSVAEVAAMCRKPVINGGDGTGEHPSQALLDAFTIREELGTLNGITITFVGDLKNGRTVHSLAQLVALYDVKLVYVSPAELKMPESIKRAIQGTGVEQEEHTELADDLIRATDILYVTRIQKERFATPEEYEAVKGAYCITPNTLSKAKKHMAVMHPLPRVDELSEAVDTDPRAAYFRQMTNGMYVRMALLAVLLAPGR